MTLKNNRAPLLCCFQLCAWFHCHMWIQTGVRVRKRLSWVLTSVTLTFDLWHCPFAWTSLLTMVITPENFMMIRWWEHGEKGVTDRQTDGRTDGLNQSYTVKCHYNACHYNANASLTRSILGSQTAPTCPHDHPIVTQHMGYRCEMIAVWSATAAMTPLSSHTNGMKQRYPTCWLCQYSRFMIDFRSNTLIIHLRCSENAINRPIWLPRRPDSTIFRAVWPWNLTDDLEKQ